MTKKMTLVKMVCPECGSERVRKDAVVEWSVDKQEFIQIDCAGGHRCGECGADEFDAFKEVAVSDTRMLFEGEVFDWNLEEAEDDHKAGYMLRVEQSMDNGHVSFEVVPTEQRTYQLPDSYQGLSGIIEIRNGKPAMNLGIDPDENGLRIDSDVERGLYVSWDDGVRPKPSTDPNFEDSPATFFDFDPEHNWLMDVRQGIAEKIFEQFDFTTGNQVVKDVGNWEIDDGAWQKTAFIDNLDDQPSIKKTLEVRFRKDLPSLSGYSLI